MTGKDRRLEFELGDTLPVYPAGTRRDTRRIRRLHPLGLRIVVRMIKEAAVTDSGLYLPEGARDTAQESVLAEVLEVASAVDSLTEEETNISGIPLKATVLIPKTAGIRVPWDENVRIVETRDVLALVDKFALS